MSLPTTPTGQAFGPTLETARLILRPPVMADFEPWCAFSADEEAARHIGGPMGPAQVWRSMMMIAGSWSLEGFSMFSVIEKESGRWIGRLGPWRPFGWPGTEVGWGVIRDCWGRGYATEGATAAMDFAFDHLGWDEVVHTIEPVNVNSQAVARRLGSQVLRQARLPLPMDVQVDVWGQSREAWRARRL
ncbi:GNAT family N-acetyltransferase [Phenylobacterium sp.]|uniref:GNAT family N-acetyltransferase n=1 Tax=Phenylobacterium sp. TaxID=1871053 RepID=UPI00272F844B|nr:GNAT family N-acetyltransferase [Phenylobacterium sp.]MDP1872666.1 GNAT family N-acetyltransferase [Phenylobacterium sp.]MDP3300058.1 GNAT family N-acetyltransferase [Phenylobacterium sp.]MDP3490855.1 GNAT family N-acetyltransferase [Phenylobacterium sp.]